MNDVEFGYVPYVAFAAEAHKNQKYGDKPYIYHLAAVELVLADFDYTEYKWKAAAWLHDTVEDTTVVLTDIIKSFGTEVAELVASVSGFGANRKEKQQCILDKLIYHPEACILKCADRIANLEAGRAEGNTSKLGMYRDEQKAFSDAVKGSVPEAMWKRLEAALNDECE